MSTQPATPTTTEPVDRLLWILSVDEPGGAAMPFPVTANEAQIVASLPSGLLEDGEDLVTCGPLDQWVEIGDAAPTRIRVRRAPCGMGCDCRLEGWAADRSEPVPPAGWSHAYDLDDDACPCGQIYAQYERWAIP
jgi:hypothetical protein